MDIRIFRLPGIHVKRDSGEGKKYVKPSWSPTRNDGSVFCDHFRSDIIIIIMKDTEWTGGRKGVNIEIDLEIRPKK